MTNSMHIRFESLEAIDSRKTLLSAQINLLKTIQHIRAYRILRKQQGLLKTKLKLKLKNLSSELAKINSELPEIDKKSLPAKHEKKAVEEKAQPKKESRDRNLEQELDSIKRKLAQLG